MRRHRRRDLRRTSREALRRATAGEDPVITGLLAAVPDIMAEARRRRRAIERSDPLTALVPIARRVIPALTTAAAILVTLSTLLFLGSPQAIRDPAETATGVDSVTSEDSIDPIDALLIAGTTEEDVDRLLSALMSLEADDE